MTSALTNIPVPQRPEHITSDWLAAILNAPVKSLTLTRIGENEGFTGSSLHRLTFTHSDADERQSLIVKLGGPLPGMTESPLNVACREVDAYLGFSQRELQLFPIDHLEHNHKATEFR